MDPELIVVFMELFWGPGSMTENTWGPKGYFTPLRKVKTILLNGATPKLHPKIIMFSRKTNGVVGYVPPFF